MNSQQRLQHWLSQAPADEGFYSPNVAPSILPNPDYVPPPASDCGSSHSEPPQMVLHWPDGRPDVPIRRSSRYSGKQPEPSLNSSQKQGKRSSSGKSHMKSNSHPSRSRDMVDAPIFSLADEGAMIPRDMGGETASRHLAQPSHHSYVQSHQSYQSRSRSLPRPSDLQSMQSSQHTIHAPPAPIPVDPPPGPPSIITSGHHFTQHHHSVVPSPTQTHVQFATPPHWHTWSSRAAAKHRPPAIIYAPSSHTQHYNYSPPMMTPYPPPPGPPPPPHPIPGGVTYSHSAPNPPLASWFSPRYPTPYPSAAGTAVAHSHKSSHKSGPRKHSRSRSRSRSGASKARVGDSDYSLVDIDAESDGSGSTYYVLPAQGQKVLVISPEDAMMYSPSTNKTKLASATKKPFLQRLRDIKDVFSSSGSSRGTSRPSGRRLHRRHSTDASGGRQ
jgi:hypothetical protein